jgi:glycosyltransferase involved in cell wall biosynthesis
MSRSDKRLPSVCVVTCYRQPDYLRAVTLRQGIKDTGLFGDITIIKNVSTGIRRYFEVFAALLKTRFTKNPDVYVITFRGYEILPFVLFIGIGKKVVYDEFINPVEWFVYEHKIFVGPLAFMGYLLKIAYKIMMKTADVILSDTDSHADYSSKLMSVKRDKYVVVPVGADETLFKPDMAKTTKKPFTVFYYGSMLPLHGIDYVLDAAVAMANRPDIEFHIVGGKKKTLDAVKIAISNGAHIHYEKWVNYEKLPALFAASDLVLGGPFGNTVQSQFVITGKTYQFLMTARPVVIGANQETKLFSDKKNALVVAQANPQAIQDAVVWAYDNPNELRTIAKKGRDLYEKEFSSERIADDLRRLFTTKHIF